MVNRYKIPMLWDYIRKVGLGMTKYIVQRKDNKFLGIGRNKWVKDIEKAFIFNSRPTPSREEKVIQVELIIK